MSFGKKGEQKRADELPGVGAEARGNGKSHGYCTNCGSPYATKKLRTKCGKQARE